MSYSTYLHITDHHITRGTFISISVQDSEHAFSGFYAGQFNQGIRDGHGVRVFHPNTMLREGFANKTMTDSTSEVPSAVDLERLLGDKIFSEFDEEDVSLVVTKSGQFPF